MIIRFQKNNALVFWIFLSIIIIILKIFILRSTVRLLQSTRITVLLARSENKVIGRYIIFNTNAIIAKFQKKEIYSSKQSTPLQLNLNNVCWLAFVLPIIVLYERNYQPTKKYEKLNFYK